MAGLGKAVPPRASAGCGGGSCNPVATGCDPCAQDSAQLIRYWEHLLGLVRQDLARAHADLVTYLAAVITGLFPELPDAHGAASVSY